MVGAVHQYFPHMPWFHWESSRRGRGGRRFVLGLGVPAVPSGRVQLRLLHRVLFLHGRSGLLWLGRFSQFDYDYGTAAASAFVACLAFLVPALLLKIPLRRGMVLSPAVFDLGLIGILGVAFAVVVLDRSIISGS
jgi:hypothetical protein